MTDVNTLLRQQLNIDKHLHQQAQARQRVVVMQNGEDVEVEVPAEPSKPKRTRKRAG